jgi:predicted HicB family RNase H-like nuclease
MASTRVQLNLKLPPQLRDQLAAAAGDTGVSLNRFCEFALATYLQFLQDQNPPTPARRRA